MNWSNYQNAVFGAIEEKRGNIFVNAVAGSGKTATIEEAIRRIPDNESVLAVAFSRDIKKELERRLGHLTNVTVQTLNGFGYGVCRAAVKRYINIKADKVETTLRFDVLDGAKEQSVKELFYKSRYLISKIIAIFKADMRWQPELSDMYAVMDRFDLDLPKGVSETQFFDLLTTTYKKCMAKTLVMDYDDQIAMPLFNNWLIPTYDWVFVDEAQDLTPAQIELTRCAAGIIGSDYSEAFGVSLETNGRAVYVGDPRQAIYQFRGADSHAVRNIIETMACIELPLSVCYRCTKAVVREAQQKVPHIEYHEGADDGSVTTINKAEFVKRAAEGDLVLCRTTAPLVQACLGFIREGRKATVKGREIGQSLIDLIDAVDCPNGDVDIFHDALCGYVSVQSEKLKRARREDALMALNDRFDTLVCLYEQCETVADMRVMICKIFSDDAVGIMLMTIHKSKGLENHKVYILHPELMPHKLATTEEALLSEDNLWYVAVTRAKKDLIWVTK